MTAPSRATRAGQVDLDLRAKARGDRRPVDELLWRRRQQLEDHLPDQFAEVVSAVVAFADPVIADTAPGLAWGPASGAWSSVADDGR